MQFIGVVGTFSSLDIPEKHEEYCDIINTCCTCYPHKVGNGKQAPITS